MIDKQINRNKKKLSYGCLSVIILTITIGVLLYLLTIKGILPYFNDSDLKKIGITTTAILIKSEQTGFFVGDSQPEMRITLKVTSKTGETWEAETEKVIPLSQLYALAPGTLFNVIYDPKDKTKVIISD